MVTTVPNHSDEVLVVKKISHERLIWILFSIYSPQLYSSLNRIIAIRRKNNTEDAERSPQTNMVQKMTFIERNEYTQLTVCKAIYTRVFFEERFVRPLKRTPLYGKLCSDSTQVYIITTPLQHYSKNRPTIKRTILRPPYFVNY